MSNIAESSYADLHSHSSKKENEFELYKFILNSRILNEEPNVFQNYLDFDCPTNILRPFILDKRLENEIILKDLYKQSLISYKNILTVYKQLARYLKIKDSLQLSQFLSLLLWCGFFSPTGVHTYKLDGRLYLDGLQSFDVFNGCGVCVAYSQLLEDFLRECGFETASIGCKEKQNMNKSSFTYLPPIIRNYDISENKSFSDSFIPDILSLMCGNNCNHAITLIKDAQGMYLYDVTNLCSLNIISPNSANGITYKGSVNIYPNESLFLLSNIDSFDLLQNLSSSSTSDIKSKRRAITQEEFISLFEDTITKFVYSLRVVKTAYADNYRDISTINKEINTYGNCKESIKTYKKIKKTTK